MLCIIYVERRPTASNVMRSLPSFAYTEWSSILKGLTDAGMISATIFMIYIWAHQNVSATCTLILLFGSLCKSALFIKKKNQGDGRE